MTSALILAALVVYLVERLHPLLTRSIQTQERLTRQPPRGLGKLPADLQMQASSYKDSWARGDAEQRFRELYEELGGDWDQVRAYTGAMSDGTTGH